MKRLFLAISIPKEIRGNLAPLQQELMETGADLKIVSLEHLHLTLKFLGDVKEVMIPEIIDKVSSVLQGPFAIKIEDVGVFPSPERINVVWVGVQSPELVVLMKKINMLLSSVRKEEHEEVPHLTLARVKSGKNKEKIREWVEKNKDSRFGEMMVTSIMLFESQLLLEGPKYTVVKEFILNQ